MVDRIWTQGLRTMALSAMASATMALFSVTAQAGASGEPIATDREEYSTFLEFLERRTGVDGELALRIIALGLRNQEDRTPSELGPDDVICEFGQPVGTNLTHILCGEVQHMRAGSGLGTEGFRSSGMTRLGDQSARFAIAVPAQRAKVERLIRMLPGLPSMNERLVRIGLHGRALPTGLPDEAEMQAFVRAYRAVSSVSDRFDPQIAVAQGERRRELIRESDRAMIEAIRASGLSVERYNSIAGHVQTEPELFTYVRERL